MDIVFVRHGVTELNKKEVYGGILDVELSPEGEKQIKILKKAIGNLKFDGVYSSPLKRAIQTAEILSNEYKIDDRLREMNFGIFEGMNYKEICDRYPKESKMWYKDFVNYSIKNGESLRDVFKRTEDFINHVKNKYRSVLAITHGGVIGCALSMVFNSDEYFYKFRVNHGMAAVISIEDNYMYIKGLNCVHEIKGIL